VAFGSWFSNIVNQAGTTGDGDNGGDEEKGNDRVRACRPTGLHGVFDRGDLAERSKDVGVGHFNFGTVGDVDLAFLVVFEVTPFLSRSLSSSSENCIG
jgi:hypothetical protein